MIATIPNLLTLARLLLVPVFLYLVVKERYLLGAVVFLVAALTDALDGFIARRNGQSSAFGANFDPFVDKTLLVTSYALLASMGIIPLWLGIVVVARDLAVFSGLLFLRGAAIFKEAGRDVAMRTTVAGKSTTILQVITVLWALVVMEGVEGGGDGVFFTAMCAATAAVTIFTGLDYAYREFKAGGKKKRG